MSNIPTPHIALDNKDDIAKTVLMPGDPLRAKYIAQTYLEDVICFNTVRNIFGYTGYYNGKKVSVMASGMGMPSIGIYSYELFSFYGVENIIRVGSAGAYTADLNVFDVVLVGEAFSESTYGKVLNNYPSILYPSNDLNEKIINCAKKLNIDLSVVNCHSSDVFYHTNKDYLSLVNKHNCKVVEMESYALFANAKLLNKNAACILTISDSFVTNEKTTSSQREKCFDSMIKIALETIND